MPDTAAYDAYLTTADGALQIAAPVARALADVAVAGETVRLVPPEHLVSGLRDGSLKYLHTATGDTGIIVERTGGAFAGHANVVRPGPAVLTGPAAWQAMALVTQQPYLHEINAKLEAVTGGIDDLRARLQHEKAGELEAIRQDLASMARRRNSSVPAAAEDRALLRQWSHRADAIRRDARLNLHRGIDAAPGGDRRKGYLHTRLPAIADAPARDFAIAALATELVIGARAELLARAEDDREVEHLLQENAETARTILGELQEDARRFATVLDRAVEHHETPDLGDKIVGGLEKEQAALGWVGIPVRRGAKALQERDTRKRERAIEEFRVAAELPLGVAEVDLAAHAPRALLLTSREDGRLELELETEPVAAE